MSTSKMLHIVFHIHTLVHTNTRFVNGLRIIIINTFDGSKATSTYKIGIQWHIHRLIYMCVCSKQHHTKFGFSLLLFIKKKRKKKSFLSHLYHMPYISVNEISLLSSRRWIDCVSSFHVFTSFICCAVHTFAPFFYSLSFSLSLFRYSFMFAFRVLIKGYFLVFIIIIPRSLGARQW